MMIACPQCQRQVQEGTVVCPSCHTPLEDASPRIVRLQDVSGGPRVAPIDGSGKRARVVPRSSSAGRMPAVGRREEPGLRTTTVRLDATDDGGEDEPEHSSGSAESWEDKRTIAASPVGPATSLGLAAGELWAALRDVGASLREMGGPDRGTLVAAVGLILATFLPFVGVPGDPWRPGIMAGGWGLVALAVWAVSLSWQRVRLLADTGGGTDEESADLRRISLKHLLCGAVATSYALYLLVLYGWLTEVRTVTGDKMSPLLRPGLFVALFFATGLAYAGLARFREDAARRQAARRRF